MKASFPLVARLLSPAFVVALVLLAVASVGMTAAINHYKIQLEKKPIYPEGGRKLMLLPRETRNWRAIGADRIEPEEVRVVLGTDNYLSRMYTPKNPENAAKPMVLDFHVAYYTGMIDTVPHVPDRCFVGGGMQIGKVLGDLPLPLDQTGWRVDPLVPEDLQGRIFKVRLDDTYSEFGGSYVRLPRDPGKIGLRTMEFLTKEGKPFYAGYFFIANGGTVSRAEGVRLLAFDLRSTYAFYLKVQVTSTTVSSGEELAEAAASLLDDLMGEVMRCVPDWVEVEMGNYPADNPARGKSADGARAD